MMATGGDGADDPMTGAKRILIHASTRYPIVSAYEFEFLKKEEVIRQRMKGCTLYFILQRPLTYMTNVRPGPDGITFEIVDDANPPIKCHLPLVENGLARPGETTDLEVLFLKKDPDPRPPYNDVGGFKIRRQDGTFAVWYSPHKFLCEALSGPLIAGMEGDPLTALDFRVHYIGQAFSQRVLRCLTGHDKVQKVLTLEGPVSEKRGNRLAWEISLAMMSIDGFDEMNLFPVLDGMDLGHGEPVLHEIRTEADLTRLFSPALGTAAPQLTNEAEAMMINRFKPAYNDILYDNYPAIANGTRSAGYTDSELVISRLPAILHTDTYRIEAVP